MLSAEKLALAMDTQDRSYRLLKWVSDAVGAGFVPVIKARGFANVNLAAHDWIEGNYESLPQAVRPSREELVRFSNFFATYLTSSFEFTATPGMRLESKTGCFCPDHARMVTAPHLGTKHLTKRDKRRAEELMCQRVISLGAEHHLVVQEGVAKSMLDSSERKSCAYSAYGHWLIQRMEGHTDGPAILALWREFAWKKTGSPIPGFELRLKDFEEAETQIVTALRLNKEST